MVDAGLVDRLAGDVQDGVVDHRVAGLHRDAAHQRGEDDVLLDQRIVQVAEDPLRGGVGALGRQQHVAADHEVRRRVALELHEVVVRAVGGRNMRRAPVVLDQAAIDLAELVGVERHPVDAVARDHHVVGLEHRRAVGDVVDVVADVRDVGRILGADPEQGAIARVGPDVGVLHRDVPAAVADLDMGVRAVVDAQPVEHDVGGAHDLDAAELGAERVDRLEGDVAGKILAQRQVTVGAAFQQDGVAAGGGRQRGLQLRFVGYGVLGHWFFTCFWTRGGRVSEVVRTHTSAVATRSGAAWNFEKRAGQDGLKADKRRIFSRLPRLFTRHILGIWDTRACIFPDFSGITRIHLD